jgi:hypothetical protein
VEIFGGNDRYFQDNGTGFEMRDNSLNLVRLEILVGDSAMIIFMTDSHKL